MCSEPNDQRPDSQTAPTPEWRAEVRDFLQTQEQRRKVFPRAVLVGLLAGMLSVAFGWALAGGDRARDGLIAWAHRYPAWGWLLPILWGAVGAGLAVYLVTKVA